MAAHLNVYNACVYYIDEGIRLCRLYISLNGNIHRLRRIGQPDCNITSVISPGDLVIAAFIDGDAFRRSQLNCCIFLRSYAIFRRTPPGRSSSASALTGRTDAIMHAASAALMSRNLCFFILKTSAFC